MDFGERHTDKRAALHRSRPPADQSGKHVASWTGNCCRTRPTRTTCYGHLREDVARMLRAKTVPWNLSFTVDKPEPGVPLHFKRTSWLRPRMRACFWQRPSSLSDAREPPWWTNCNLMGVTQPVVHNLWIVAAQYQLTLMKRRPISADVRPVLSYDQRWRLYLAGRRDSWRRTHKPSIWAY